MDVGKVSVPVHRRFVHMRMGMRFAAIPLERVSMLMVLIVPVRVLVLESFVDVFVDVFFAHMQPEAQRHEGSGNAELRSERVAKKQHRHGAADKWGEAKVGACSCGSEVS